LPDYCSTLDLSPTETATTCPSTTTAAFGGDDGKPIVHTRPSVSVVYPGHIQALDVWENNPCVSTELAGLSVRQRPRSSSPSPGHTRVQSMSKGQGGQTPHCLNDEFAEAANRSVEVQTACRQGSRGEAARKLQTNALVLSSQLAQTLRELDEVLLWEENTSPLKVLNLSTDQSKTYDTEGVHAYVTEDDLKGEDLHHGEDLNASQTDIRVQTGTAEAKDSDEAAHWLRVAACAEQRLVSDVLSAPHDGDKHDASGLVVMAEKAPEACEDERLPCQAEPSGPSSQPPSAAADFSRLLGSPTATHGFAAINAQFNTPSRTTNPWHCGTPPWSLWPADIDAERAVAFGACEAAAELSRRLAEAMKEVEAARSAGTPVKETSQTHRKATSPSTWRAPPPTPCRGRSRTKGQPAPGAPPTPRRRASSTAPAKSAAPETPSNHASHAAQNVSVPGTESTAEIHKREAEVNSKGNMDDSCHRCEWYLLGTPKQQNREATGQSHGKSPSTFIARAASAAAIRALKSPKLHLDAPNPLVEQDSEKAPESPDVKRGVGLNSVLTRLSDLESWLGDVRRVGARAERSVIGIESPTMGTDISPGGVYPSLAKTKRKPWTLDSMSPDSLDGSPSVAINSLKRDKESKERALRRHASAPPDLVGFPLSADASDTGSLRGTSDAMPDVDAHDEATSSKPQKCSGLKLKFSYCKGKVSADPWISSQEGPSVASNKCTNSLKGHASLFGA